MSRSHPFAPSLALALAVTVFAGAAEPTAKTGTPPTVAELRGAIERSIPFLTEEASNWMATRKCATCHYLPMTIWSLQEVKNRGFKIDDKEFTALRAQALKSYAAHPKFKPVGQDGSGDGLSRATSYLTVAAATAPKLDQESTEALAKFSAHLLATQEKDGSWKAGYGQPPVADSLDVTTLYCVLALQAAPQTDATKEAVFKSRERALAWLKETKGSDSHQSLALRVLLSARVGKPDMGLVEQLLGRQNADGGWSQVKELPSDAFATGQSLYVLAAAGLPVGHKAVQAAQAFLLRTQKKDGSWLVKTRTKGGNVIISYTGTAWATLGLVRTLPEQTEEKTMTGRMVYYSGRVQGVGFRATAVDLARGRPITGWVRNRADGSVQLLVEGAEKDVEAFLQAVREQWKGHVEKEQIDKQAASGAYRSFEIAR